MIHDIWRTHQFIGLILTSVAISYFVFRQLSIIAGLSLLYILVSSLFIFSNTENYFGKYFYMMGVSGARAFAAVILPVFLIGLINKYRQIKLLYSAIEALAIIDSALVLIFGYGIFNNGAMDATFLAMIYPSIAFRPAHLERASLDLFEGMFYSFSLLLPIAAILSAKGTAAYLVLGAGMGSYLLSRGFYKVALFSTTSILGLGLFVVRSSEFFQNNGRFNEWRLAMRWWWQYANVWVGTGAGTFEWIGPLIDNLSDHRTTNLFLFLHNEYLQSLFEYGIIGVTLFFALYVYCLVKTFRNRRHWIFSSLIAFGVACTIQFPLRFFLSQLFVALLLRDAHEKTEC